MREQRLAALLVERLGISPPVDVYAVAARMADVESDLIPGSCDGVVVGLSGGRKRPLIVVARDAPPRRTRFTLAHEIGHVALPWHIGTAACDTGLLVRDPAEIEANRFAAPRQGSAFDPSRFRAFASSAERVSFGGRYSHWFRYGESPLPDTADDPRDWRSVLKDLTGRHASDEAAARSLAHSISSIVGYAFGLALRDPPLTPEKVLGHVRSRFAGRGDLPVALLDDPEFSVYLAKKTEDLARRRF
jgi:hypothetical protein